MEIQLTKERLTSSRVSLLMTSIFGIGVLGTLAMTMGALNDDRSLMFLGIVGEGLTLATSMALLGWCMKDKVE